MSRRSGALWDDDPRGRIDATHAFEAAGEVLRGENPVPVLHQFGAVAEGRRARVFLEDPGRVQPLILAEDVLDDLHLVLRRCPVAAAAGELDVLAPAL